MSASAPALAPPPPASPKPLYAQARDLLLARVRGGEWGAGESLPNEHVLSGELGVSIGTVRRAVAELERHGVLVRKQGRGTYVSGQGSAALQARFCALRDGVGARVTASIELIGIARRPPSLEERAAMPATQAQGVFEVAQRLTAGGRAIGLEVSVLPAALLPQLETQLRFGQPLYPLLAEYGLLVTRVEDTIGVEMAGADAAAQLGCTGETMVLVALRRAIAIDGAVVERRAGRYLAGAVRYAGTTTPD